MPTRQGAFLNCYWRIILTAAVIATVARTIACVTLQKKVVFGVVDTDETELVQGAYDAWFTKGISHETTLSLSTPTDSEYSYVFENEIMVRLTLVQRNLLEKLVVAKDSTAYVTLRRNSTASDVCASTPPQRVECSGPSDYRLYGGRTYPSKKCEETSYQLSETIAQEGKPVAACANLCTATDGCVLEYWHDSRLCRIMSEGCTLLDSDGSAVLNTTADDEDVNKWNSNLYYWRCPCGEIGCETVTVTFKPRTSKTKLYPSRFGTFNYGGGRSAEEPFYFSPQLSYPYLD